MHEFVLRYSTFQKKTTFSSLSLLYTFVYFIYFLKLTLSVRKTKQNAKVLLWEIDEVSEPSHLAVVSVFGHSKTRHIFTAWRR